IARELPLPTRRMPLLDGEIKGVHRLQQVASMLYGGEGRPISTSHRTDETCAPAAFWQRLKLGEAVVPHLVPANGHGRVVFFAGKGGVGKTAVSCLTAVWLARQGYRTLLLTTDPAAHLGDVLEQPVGDEAAPVQGVANLWAARIDAKASATDYKARILADARAQGRSEQSLRAMAEELDSPCTEEMAAFDRFIDFASQELGTTSGRYDLIVFDTAPTGHTLRLLELPIDWSQQLSVKIYAWVDSAAADDVAKARFGQVIEMMRNPSLSTFAFVMYPESTPIVEAERAMQELRTVGIPTSLVVANLVLPPEECTGDFVCRRWQMQEKYLTEMQRRFQTPLLAVPLLSHEVRGLDVLTELGERIYGQTQRTIRDQIGERRTEYASQTNN
ncbi:MAG: ArsA family ATPase, partial [Chloroflexota bacterium]